MNPILSALAAKLAPIIAAKLLEYLPLIAGTVVKAFLDQLKQQLPNIDLPDIPLPPVVQNARDTLNEILPDWDTGIGPLDEVMDAWRPKR